MTHRGQENRNPIIFRSNGDQKVVIVRVLKEKTVEFSASSKIILQTWREIQTHPDKQRLKEFNATKPAL